MSDHIVCRHGAFLDMQRCCYCDQERIAELEAERAKLREAISNMNPNNPFSVIEVQILVEEGEGYGPMHMH